MDTDKMYCSFCRKKSDIVDKLISSPHEKAYICDECVLVCVSILEDAGMKIRTPSEPLQSASQEDTSQEVDLSLLGIKPRFATLKFQVRRDHCFHLCPFTSPFDEIYRDHVRKAAITAGLTIDRAD